MKDVYDECAAFLLLTFYLTPSGMFSIVLRHINYLHFRCAVVYKNELSSINYSAWDRSSCLAAQQNNVSWTVIWDTSGLCRKTLKFYGCYGTFYERKLIFMFLCNHE